jgi:hypothetical protein
MTPKATKALNFLAAMPGGTVTVTNKDLRGLMLETGGTMLACGRLYKIRSRNLGAGVYEVSLKLANP